MWRRNLCTVYKTEFSTTKRVNEKLENNLQNVFEWNNNFRFIWALIKYSSWTEFTIFNDVFWHFRQQAYIIPKELKELSRETIKQRFLLNLCNTPYDIQNSRVTRLNKLLKRSANGPKKWWDYKTGWATFSTQIVLLFYRYLLIIVF